MGKVAIVAQGTEFVPVPNSIPINDDGTAERWSAAVIPYPNKKVARIAGCSTETVKAWRAGRQLPQYKHLRNLRHLPHVRSFVAQEFGFSDAAQISPNEIVSKLLAEIDLRAGDSTHHAAMVRAVRGRLTRDD